LLGDDTVTQVKPTSPLPVDDVAAAIALLALDAQLLSPSAATSLLTRSVNSSRGAAELLLAEAGVAPTLAAIAKELRIRFVDLSQPGHGLKTDPELVEAVGAARLQRISALPMRDGEKIVVLAANPFDLAVQDVARSVFGAAGFVPALGSRTQIHDALTLTGDTTEPEAPTAGGPRGTVLEWVERLLTRAVAERASDVHLRYNRKGALGIRFRVDGRLRNVANAPAGRDAEVVGALMNRAGMDVANTLEPQDGTFSFTASGRQVDARVSMIPHDVGPSMVLRLLDVTTTRLVLDDLGASPAVVDALRRCVSSAHGTIVTSGPTGSGKSTTMYALLRELDPDDYNILTIEDPVEYRVEGIGQTQVRGDGTRRLTFAKALRAILRHDPDIILVGEIRDAETATVAMEAAITGHLVLSTTHAPSAPAVFARLIQMGVPAYLVAEALTAVAGQRLLRRLHGCAQPDTPTAEERYLCASWGAPVPEQIWRPVGCTVCRDSGYLGRVMAMELLEPDQAMRDAVLRQASAVELEQLALANGRYTPLIVDAVRHVAEGNTSLDEVLRVIASSTNLEPAGELNPRPPVGDDDPLALDPPSPDDADGTSLAWLGQDGALTIDSAVGAASGDGDEGSGR